jgi:hypothetical protein
MLVIGHDTWPSETTYFDKLNTSRRFVAGDLLYLIVPQRSPALLHQTVARARYPPRCRRLREHIGARDLRTKKSTWILKFTQLTENLMATHGSLSRAKLSK